MSLLNINPNPLLLAQKLEDLCHKTLYIHGALQHNGIQYNLAQQHFPIQFHVAKSFSFYTFQAKQKGQLKYLKQDVAIR